MSVKIWISPSENSLDFIHSQEIVPSAVMPTKQEVVQCLLKKKIKNRDQPWTGKLKKKICRNVFIYSIIHGHTVSVVVSTVALQFSGWSPVFLHVLNNVYHWVLYRYSVGLLCIDYRCDYVASEVADPTGRHQGTTVSSSQRHLYIKKELRCLFLLYLYSDPQQ